MEDQALAQEQLLSELERCRRRVAELEEAEARSRIREKALRDSEERYRTIVRNSPVGIFRSTFEGRFLEVNPALAEMLGYDSPEEVIREIHDIGKQIFVRTDDRQTVVSEQLGSDGVVQHLNRYRRKDGSEFIANLYVRTVRDEEGRPIFMEGIVEDITERKQQESVALARLNLLEFADPHTLEELLQATLDKAEALTGSRIGFYHFLEADQETLSLQAWSSNTIRSMCTAEGKGLHYKISEAGVWVDCVRKRRAVVHNDYYSLPHRKGFPPGHAEVIRELVVPVFRGTRIVAILGVGNKPADYTSQDVSTVTLLADLAWDIAERKLAKTELQRSNDLLRAIIEAAPTAIIGLDLDGNVHTVWNPAAEKMLGWSAQEVMGHILPSVPVESQEEFRRFREAIRSGKTLDGVEVRRQKRGGIPIDYSIYASPLHDADGRITGNICVLVDITERKRVEEELRQYRTHLEELVRERTEQLQERTLELEAANTRLLEADRLKSVFLASMSHELRTPLNSIIGFTGIMLMGLAGELSEEQERQLKMVKNSADHLLGLINDVLDIAKIEAGKVTPVQERFDIEELVNSVLETFAPLAAEKGLQLIRDLPSRVTIVSDKRRVTQILMNIIGNAVKFTDYGSVKLSAKALGDDTIELRFTDTGTGIKEEDIKKLFFPFQQIDSSLTKAHEGTGLGLYLSRKLVFLLGGDIRVSSTYGEGSEFTVTLPLVYRGPHGGGHEKNSGS